MRKFIPLVSRKAGENPLRPPKDNNKNLKLLTVSKMKGINMYNIISLIGAILLLKIYDKTEKLNKKFLNIISYISIILYVTLFL